MAFWISNIGIQEAAEVFAKAGYLNGGSMPKPIVEVREPYNFFTRHPPKWKVQFLGMPNSERTGFTEQEALNNFFESVKERREDCEVRHIPISF